MESAMFETAQMTKEVIAPTPICQRGAREDFRTKTKIELLLILLGMILTFSCPVHATPDIRFGTLPVIQCLPVFVAAEKGFFKEQGIAVELVAFNSALEKDVAFTSGQISGYFGDMLTCMVLNGNKIPIRIVTVVYNATGAQRMFAFVLAPKYADKGLKDAVSVGIAVSSNTILDFLTAKFLASKGITVTRTKMVEIKNIPIRLQMVIGGQVGAAVLPEPLATLAEMKGARSVLDDAGKGWSVTVLAFKDGFMNQNPTKVKAFLKAVQKASDYINNNPDGVRAIMNRECRMPDQLKQSFAIPRFPMLALPTPGQVADVSQWLHQKGSIKKEMSYTQMVADGYLP